MDKNTKIALGVGALVLVALIGYAVTRGPKTGDETVKPATTTTPNLNDQTAVKKPTTVTAPVKKPGTAGNAATVTKQVELDYNQTVAKYDANGYRMQFVNCGARPATMTVKRNVSFMLDNRDGKAHKIAVGATTYSIGAYGWRVTSLSTVGKINITCDGGGSGFIVVQP